jgi:hypothetical protein
MVDRRARRGVMQRGRSAAGVLMAVGFVATGLPAVARADEPLPVPAPRSGDILRIPGLPPVELPPGAKVFGPQGPQTEVPRTSPRPSTRGESPGNNASPSDKRDEEQAGDGSREKSQPRLSLEAQRQQVLDSLFKQLAEAGDPDQAKAVAAAIEKVWLHTGSDTANLLMSRALAAMSAGQIPLSIELLDHVVEIAPNWAEAWNKRATARFLADDYDGSMTDIDRTLHLEPRHYGALGGLATILQRSGNDRRALEVLRRVLLLYPQQPEIKRLIERMAPDIDGRDI